jgi:ribulose-5-phosphate 4-epimerase/fuculose-1-phosphate aldolase
MAQKRSAIRRIVPAIDREERELRVQLAAMYRIIDHFGWAELIWTHTTVRVPGPERHFLINPYGLRYDEVTASNLVKLDIEGNIVAPSDYGVNPAGFAIHSAVHMARPDAHCVMHTHTVAGMAVAALADGLLPISAYALGIHDRIAYHDWQPALDRDERPRLAASLGNKNVLILRNHGLLVCGHTIGQAFVSMYRLERACQVQLAACNAGRKLTIPPPEICEASARVEEVMWGPKGGAGELEFAAMMRLIDKKDPSYRE